MEKTIYYGGPILTLEEGPAPEALLVKDGRIAAVGSRRDLLLERDAGTRLEDLEGRALLPAFVDAHSHLTAQASALASVSLEGAESHEEIIRRIQAYKRERRVPPGTWITAFGYDHNRLPQGRHPDRALLDAAAPDNPLVAAHASGHMGAANSAALQALGVTRDTPDPPGGVIGRGPDRREPNGYLEERAFTETTARIPRPDEGERLELLAEAQRLYFSYGITTIQDGMTDPDWFRLLRRANGEGRLLADVVCYIDPSQRALAEAYPACRRRYEGGLKLGGYKIFLDGSPQGRTAWLTRPYAPAGGAVQRAENGAVPGPAGEETDPAGTRGEARDYAGYPIHTDREVERAMETALADHMQLLVHCNGDAAADQMIRAWAAARQGFPAMGDARPVMIHAQLVRPDQLERMKRLGMLPSFFVAHTWHWGDIHLRNLGRERAGRISPTGTAQALGLPFTLHQDTPVLPPDMLFTLWCAVHRRTQGGRRLEQAEALTPAQALAAVTRHAAYQYFEEGEKGTLRPGKRADMVVLDRDPLSVPPEALRELQVCRTIKDGQTVYARDGAPRRTG